LEEKFTQTKAIKDTTNPDFNHERVVSMQGTQEVKTKSLKEMKETKVYFFYLIFLIRDFITVASN
jgi:hypothetical protein